MRELKFRAWDKELKEMRHDFLGKSGDNSGDWILFFQPTKIAGKMVDGIKNPYPRERFVLMQFTGLQDRNGADIYEGDIIQFRISTINGNLAPPHIFEVINKKGCFKAGHKHFSQFNCYDIIEVVGNVFENPELLEGD